MKAEQVTFSVIVPVYNMEQYLSRCIDSVLAQTYDRYEIIIVDDGSNDGSPKILDIYQKSNARIKVIHKKNGGIGTAIPVGIKEAEGDYVVFVDSDDYIDKEMLSVLNNNFMKNGRPDTIQFGLRMINEAGEYVREERHGNYSLDNTEIVLEDHFLNHPTPSLACRAFKKELFSGVMCPEQNIGIDEVLIIQLLEKTNTFLSIDDVLYNVYLRSDSVSRSVFTKYKIQEYKKVYEILFDFAFRKNKMLWNYIAIKYLKLLIDILLEMQIDDSEYFDLRNAFNEYYSEVKYSMEFRKETLSFKMGAALFYKSPVMYQKLKKLRKR